MKTLMRIITISFIISINNYKSDACIWFDNGEGYRISMFRAETDALYGFRAFYYTPNILNEYLPRQNSKDRYANCMEWQKILGGNCKTADVFKMLYQTSPKEVLKDISTFMENHQNNTFIAELSKHKEWSAYFLFAKLNELYNSSLLDYWNDKTDKYPTMISDKLLTISQEILEQTKDQKIKERTAFHLMRIYKLRDESKNSIDVYEKYFANRSSKSVIKTWATLHYAEALQVNGKEVEANLLYSKVFNLAEEKRIRAYRLFNIKLFDQTLKIAKTKEEKATLWAIKAINTTGPALKYLKNVVANNPKNNAIPLLIMREINKLEDWIFTPEIAGTSPAMHPVKYWNNDYEKIKQQNRKKDLAYLQELKLYIKKITPQLNSSLNDYLLIARAHLAILARQNKEALALFKKVSYNSNNSILVQRSIELSLYYIFENKLDNNKAKQKLASTLEELEKLAKKDYFYYKHLYSLTKLISGKLFDKNKIVAASLIGVKSGNYKECFYSGGKYCDKTDYGYYSKIAYLDDYADTKDIDVLLKLIAKRDKNKFEEYLCDQKLADKNALLDLKGTIALRKGDIETAHKAFSKVQHNFWETTYAFKNYLRKDPFIIPYYKFESGKPYKFNKADVVKKLLEYYNEAQKNPNKAGHAYVKIGNFFYNSSFCGNSWMMLSYYRTSSDVPSDYEGENISTAQKNFENSFHKCSIALEYYNKAEQVAKNPEDIATILIMKHLCKLVQHNWKNLKQSEYVANDLKKLYKDYQNTETFKKIKCPTLDYFVGA